jgi:hypothetical protein
MKKLLLGVLMVMSLAVSAHAEDTSGIQVEDTFEKARKWLSEENLTVTGNSSGLRDDNSAFTQEAILFCGEGFGNPAHANPAQRETMAKRAAVVVAQRSLAEYLEGFALVGDTLVKDGSVNYDVIRSSVAAYIKGAQVVFQDYNRDKDMAIAIIKVGLHGPKGFGSMIYEKLVGDPKLNKELASKEPAFKAAPVPLDEAYDGLIVDATGQSFRPALINRLFTVKGEVLYDPAKVSKKVLVEQGCGEYANSVDKARSALAARGVKNPLVVKAEGASSKADLQISDEDAVRVFSANQKGGFFSAAKVAFVLK